MYVHNWTVEYCGHVWPDALAIAESIAEALPCGELSEEEEHQVVSAAVKEGVAAAVSEDLPDVRELFTNHLFEHFSFVPTIRPE